MFRHLNSTISAPTTMATANFNSEDTTITEPVVNNADYRYWIDTSTIDTGDQIWGVKIE